MGTKIEQFLADDAKKDLLRFSTAGSVDDGKSTLIGRLLHDSKMVYEDQLASVKKASGKINNDVAIDFALLTDGLKAEREQGITIDVAYRYFATPKRKFIIADSPGHEQYTRNMATGASTANLTIILIDARYGVLIQSKRHSFIASLLRIPHFLVAVNKMDLVDYSQEVFENIKRDYTDFAAKLNIPDLRFIPISALKGDNVVEHGTNTPWYTGPTLLEHLENVYIASDRNLVDFRFPVQYVLRPNLDFRGFCGQIISGGVRAGDKLVSLPSMRESRVKSIVTFDGDLGHAFPPQSVTITMEDEIDISRGEMLCHPNNLPQQGRHFESMLVWMDEQPMDLAKRYFVKHTSRSCRARIEDLRYRVDVNSLHRDESVKTLALNEIGRVMITSAQPLFFDPYAKNRATGSFILIDPITNNTAAAGMIIDSVPAERLRHLLGERTERVKGMSGISAEERSRRLGQQAATVWLTGLHSCGKNEIAYALERELFDRGCLVMVLDGRSSRAGIARELDFTVPDRTENLRRAAEVARLANDHGLIAVCAFISPTRELRAMARSIVGHPFIEVHVDAPIEYCETRDPDGLYAKAKTGDIAMLPGVDVPYETPETPDLVVKPADTDAAAAAAAIANLMADKGLISK